MKDFDSEWKILIEGSRNISSMKIVSHFRTVHRPADAYNGSNAIVHREPPLQQHAAPDELHYNQPAKRYLFKFVIYSLLKDII